MKLLEVAKQIRKPSSVLCSFARKGIFKTAVKVKEDHREVWYIDNDEANLFIAEYKAKLI